MKLAVLILSLILAFIVFVQSMLVAAGESLANEPSDSSGGLGVLVALGLLLGGAFALGLPRASVTALGLTALVGVAAGTSSSFEDLLVWGVVAGGLAVLEWFGWRKARRPVASLPSADGV